MNGDTRSFTGRLVFGLILLTLGLLWTADNLGFVHASQVLRWWPLLLLVFGASRLLGWGSPRQVVLGTLCTVMGALMIGDVFGLVHAGLGLIWPLALVALGVEILMRGARASGQMCGAGETSDASDFVRSFTLMGGSSTRCTSQAMQGAELSAILGGVELDLREAKPAGDRMVLEAFAFMGGIDIAVPPGWHVEFQSTPILGGMADTRAAHTDEPRTATLVVRGVVILGGLNVGDEPTGQIRAGIHARRHRRARYVRWEGGEAYVGPEGVRFRGRDREGAREVRVDPPGPDEGGGPGEPPAGPR